MSAPHDTLDLPAWPVYSLTVHDGGRVDAFGPLVPEAGHPDRASAVGAVASAAARLGRPVRAEATEPDGTVWHLAISPDGTVGELPDDGSRARTPKRHTGKNARAGSGAAEPVAPVRAADLTEPVAPVEAVEPGGPVRTGRATHAAPGSIGRPDPADTASDRPGPPAVMSPRPDPEPAPAAAAAYEALPGPAAPTGREAAAPRAGAEVYAEPLAQVTDLLQKGRIGEAAALAVRLDEHAAGALGLSHPDALRIREIRARVTSLDGDTAAGVRLFRDVAERWHYRGNAEHAEAAAVRAETLWLQMTHPGAALSAGIDVVRLRNQIPGENGEALSAVLEHRAWLETAGGAPGPVPPREDTANAPAGTPPLSTTWAGASSPAVTTARAGRPVLSWERPAQEPRTA